MEADTVVDVVPAAPAPPAASADFPAVVDSPGIAPADESAIAGMFDIDPVAAAADAAAVASVGDDGVEEGKTYWCNAAAVSWLLGTPLSAG